MVTFFFVLTKFWLMSMVESESLKQSMRVVLVLLFITSLIFIFSIIVENVAEQCVTSVVKMNLHIQSWVLKILFACVMNVMKPSQMMSKLESWSIES